MSYIQGCALVSLCSQDPSLRNIAGIIVATIAMKGEISAWYVTYLFLMFV